MKNIYTNQTVHGTQEITSDQTVKGNQIIGQLSNGAKTQTVYGVQKVLSATDSTGATVSASQQIGTSSSNGSQTIYGNSTVSGTQTVTKLVVLKSIDGTSPSSGQVLAYDSTKCGLKYVTLSGEKVKQTPSTASEEHYILVKKTNDVAEETDGVLFANPTYKPSINLNTGQLTIPSLKLTNTGGAAEAGATLVMRNAEDGVVEWGDPVPTQYLKSITFDQSAKKYTFRAHASGSDTNYYLSFVEGIGITLSMGDTGALTINADTAFEAQVYDTLPTASESLKNTIALIPNAGLWTASTEYTTGTQVHRLSGSTYTYYQCSTTHVSRSSFDSTEETYWTTITRSAIVSYKQYACTNDNKWASYTYYAVNAKVYIINDDTTYTYYKCTTAHTSGLTFDSTERANWAEDSEGSVTWSWKQIGTTNIDLSNYVQLSKVGGGTQAMSTPLANSSSGLALPTSAFRNISAGTADPSSGNLGDVYLQYGGTPHLGTDTVGSVDQPIYLDGGTPTTANKLAFSNGTCISISSSTSNKVVTRTINHSNVTRSDPTASTSTISDHTFTAVTGVTTSNQGHVTGVSTTKFTIPGTTVYAVTGTVTMGTATTKDVTDLGFDPKIVQIYETLNSHLVQLDVGVTLGLTDENKFTINRSTADSVTWTYEAIGW